jgi:hypothetical protein
MLWPPGPDEHFMLGAQSPLPLQLVGQTRTAFLHLYGVQSVVVFVHVPAPSHEEIVSIVPSQLIAGQPLASSVDPAGSGPQLPCMPAIAHDLQAPQLATAQQTPLVQKPLAHSPPLPHATPLALAMAQTPETHAKPVAHWLLDVQLVRQALLPHT